MHNSPRDSRNRKGCFAILAILIFFSILYFLVSLNSKPGNSIASNIQTLPAPPR